MKTGMIFADTKIEELKENYCGCIRIKEYNDSNNPEQAATIQSIIKTNHKQTQIDEWVRQINQYKTNAQTGMNIEM